MAYSDGNAKNRLDRAQVIISLVFDYFRESK